MGGRTNEGLARPLFFVLEVFAIQTHPIMRERRGLRMGGRTNEGLARPLFFVFGKKFSPIQTQNTITRERRGLRMGGPTNGGLARPLFFVLEKRFRQFKHKTQ